MSVTMERVEKIIDAWRDGAESVDGWQSPAGPLFMGGEYAESEITMAGPGVTVTCGTACSGSRTRFCC